MNRQLASYRPEKSNLRINMIKSRNASQSSFKYLLFFLGIKPFVDLMWSFEVILGLNLLEVYGAAVFGWAFKYLYTETRNQSHQVQKILFGYFLFLVFYLQCFLTQLVVRIFLLFLIPT